MAVRFPQRRANLPQIGPENPLVPQVVLPNGPTPEPHTNERVLHAWAPDSDVYVPDNAGAEQYVPAREAAPPQLPSPLQRIVPLEFEPHGMLQRYDNAGSDLSPGFQLGFTAHTVQVDNYSPVWLYLPVAYTWIPPYQWGVSLQIPSGTQVAEWRRIDPYGNVATGASTQPINTRWFEDFLPPSSGTDISGSVGKGTITTQTVVSVVNTGSGTQVLAANPGRVSAFFQNLGANLIALGPDNSAVWTPATTTGIQLAGSATPAASFNDTSSVGAWRAIAATGATNLLVIEVSR